eukprot:573745-Rhodomonas_salina.2
MQIRCFVLDYCMLIGTCRLHDASPISTDAFVRRFQASMDLFARAWYVPSPYYPEHRSVLAQYKRCAVRVGA